MAIFFISCIEDGAENDTFESSNFIYQFENSFRDLGESDKSFVETNDHGLIVVGTHHDQYLTENNNRNIYISKISNKGNLLWEKSIGGIWDDYGCCIEEFNNEYYILGFKMIDGIGLGFKVPYVIRIDNNGKLIWEQTFDLFEKSANIQGYISKTSDNNLIICGSHNKFEPVPFLLKIDENGSVIWSREYFDQLGEATNIKVLEIPNSNTYAVLGHPGPYNLCNESIFYYIYEDGTFNGKVVYENSRLYSFVFSNDAMFLTGQARYPEYDFKLIKYDGQFSSKVFKTANYWGGEGNAIRLDKTGNLIVTGQSGIDDYVEHNGGQMAIGGSTFLGKFDQSLDSIWIKYNLNTSNPTSLEITEDNNYLIGTSTNIFRTDPYSYFTY